MTSWYGDFPEDATVRIEFNTFSSDDPSASVTITNLADADIMVHKDGGLTQIATDGATVVINFDGITGNHMVTIDTSVDAAYSTGSEYQVRIEGTTVDGGTINAWIGSFSIENRSSSLSAAALANLIAMYDGSGYTDDTAPAARSQVENISTVGAAVHVTPIASPNGFTITTGSEVNTEDATTPLDGTRHELSDDAGTLDCLYKFNIGGDSAPVSVTFTGIYNSNNDSFIISGNTGTDGTPVWVQIGTLGGTNSASNTVHTFTMFNNMIVSDVSGQVQIRINNTGLTSSSFDTDQVFISKSDTSRSVGYELGQIWINTGASNTSTESFVDGTADNPVSTLAAAITISGNVGLTDFHVINGSSITLAANSDNHSYFGNNWTLAFGGQSMVAAYVQGASISGVYTGLGAKFVDCALGTVTCDDDAHFINSSIGGTLTLVAGDIFIDNCHDANSAVANFAAAGATTLHIHGYRGEIETQNMAAGDVVEIGGSGAFISNANNAAGTINIRGAFVVTNNGSATIVLDDNQTGVDAILLDTGTTLPATLATAQADLDIITGADGAVLLSGTQASIDAIEADTNELQGDDVPGLIAALNNYDPTAQMTESYAANGVAPTRDQAQFAIHQMLMQFGIASTSLTVRKLDNSTTAFVVTLDDATSPTDAKRV